METEGCGLYCRSELVQQCLPPTQQSVTLCGLLNGTLISSSDTSAGAPTCPARGSSGSPLCRDRSGASCSDCESLPYCSVCHDSTTGTRTCMQKSLASELCVPSLGRALFSGLPTCAASSTCASSAQCPAQEVCILGNCQCPDVYSRNPITNKCEIGTPTVCPSTPRGDMALANVTCPIFGFCSPTPSNITTANLTLWAPCSCSPGYTLAPSFPGSPIQGICLPVSVTGSSGQDVAETSPSGFGDVYLHATGQAESSTGAPTGSLALEFDPSYSAEPDDFVTVQAGCGYDDPVVAQFLSPTHNRTVPSLTALQGRVNFAPGVACARVTHVAPRGKVSRGPTMSGFRFRSVIAPSASNLPACTVTDLSLSKSDDFKYYLDFQIPFAQVYCRDWIIGAHPELAVNAIKVSGPLPTFYPGSTMLLFTRASRSAPWQLADILAAERPPVLPNIEKIFKGARDVKVRFLSGHGHSGAFNSTQLYGGLISGAEPIASVGVTFVIGLLGRAESQSSSFTVGALSCETYRYFTGLLKNSLFPEHLALPRRADVSCELPLCSEFAFAVNSSWSQSFALFFNTNATESLLGLNETILIYAGAPRDLSAYNSSSSGVSVEGFDQDRARSLFGFGRLLLAVSGRNVSSSPLVSPQGLVVHGTDVVIVYQQPGAADVNLTAIALNGNTSGLCLGRPGAPTFPPNSLPGPKFSVRTHTPTTPAAPNPPVFSLFSIDVPTVEAPRQETSVPYVVIDSSEYVKPESVVTLNKHQWKVTVSGTQASPLSGITVIFTALPIASDDSASVFVFRGSGRPSPGTLAAAYVRDSARSLAIDYLTSLGERDPQAKLFGAKVAADPLAPSSGVLYDTFTGPDGTVFRIPRAGGSSNSTAPNTTSASVESMASLRSRAIVPPLDLQGHFAASIVLVSGSANTPSKGFSAIVAGALLFEPLAPASGPCNVSFAVIEALKSTTAFFFDNSSLGSNFTANSTANSTVVDVSTNTTTVVTGTPTNTTFLVAGGITYSYLESADGSKEVTVSMGRYAPRTCSSLYMDLTSLNPKGGVITVRATRLDTELDADRIEVRAIFIANKQNVSYDDALSRPSILANISTSALVATFSGPVATKASFPVPSSVFLVDFRADEVIQGRGFELVFSVPSPASAELAPLAGIPEFCGASASKRSVLSFRERAGAFQHSPGSSEGKPCVEWLVDLRDEVTPLVPGLSEVDESFIEFEAFSLSGQDTLTLYALSEPLRGLGVASTAVREGVNISINASFAADQLLVPPQLRVNDTTLPPPIPATNVTTVTLPGTSLGRASPTPTLVVTSSMFKDRSANVTRRLSFRAPFGFVAVLRAGESVQGTLDDGDGDVEVAAEVAPDGASNSTSGDNSTGAAAAASAGSEQNPANAAASQSSKAVSSFTGVFWTPVSASGCLEHRLEGGLSGNLTPFPGAPYASLGAPFCERWLVAAYSTDPLRAVVEFSGFTTFALSGDSQTVVVYDPGQAAPGSVTALRGSSAVTFNPFSGRPDSLGAFAGFPRLVFASGDAPPAVLGLPLRTTGPNVIVEYVAELSTATAVGAATTVAPFTASWKVLDNPPPIAAFTPDPPGDPFVCPTVLAYTVPSGAMSSPNPYPNGQCYEYYIAPQGAKPQGWTLTFDYFSTDPGTDVVTVFEGSGPVSRELGRYSGLGLSVPTILVNATDATIVLQTDAAGRQRGIQFSWRLLSEAEITSTTDLRLDTKAPALRADGAREDVPVRLAGLPTPFALNSASAATEVSLTMTASAGFLFDASLAGLAGDGNLGLGLAAAPNKAQLESLRAAASKTLVLTGGVGNVTAALANTGVAYLTEVDGCGSITVSFELTLPNGGPLSVVDGSRASGSFLVECVNDPPVVEIGLPRQVPLLAEVGLFFPFPLSKLSDPDNAPEGSLSITLTGGYAQAKPNPSVLSTSSPTRMSSFSRALVLRGTIAALRDAAGLAEFGFVYPREYCWARTVPLKLTVTLNDLGGTGAGGPLSSSDSVALTADCSAAGIVPGPVSVTAAAPAGPIAADGTLTLLPRGTATLHVAMRLPDPAGSDASTVTTVECVSSNQGLLSLQGNNASSVRFDLPEGRGVTVPSVGILSVTLNSNSAAVSLTCSVVATTGHWVPALLPPTTVTIIPARTSLVASELSVVAPQDQTQPVSVRIALSHAPQGPVFVSCVVSTGTDPSSTPPRFLLEPASPAQNFTAASSFKSFAFRSIAVPGGGLILCSVVPGGVGAGGGSAASPTGYRGDEAVTIAYSVLPATVRLTGPRGRFAVDYEHSDMPSKLKLTLSVAVLAGQTANVRCLTSNRTTVTVDQTALFQPSQSAPSEVVIPIRTGALGVATISCAIVSGSPLFLGASGEIEVVVMRGTKPLLSVSPAGAILVGSTVAVNVTLPVLDVPDNGTIVMFLGMDCAGAPPVTVWSNSPGPSASAEDLAFLANSTVAQHREVRLKLADDLPAAGCSLNVASLEAGDLRVIPASITVFSRSLVAELAAPSQALAGASFAFTLTLYRFDEALAVWGGPNVELRADPAWPAVMSVSPDGRLILIDPAVVPSASAVAGGLNMTLSARTLRPGPYSVSAGPVGTALKGSRASLVINVVGVARSMCFGRDSADPLVCSARGSCLSPEQCWCGRGALPDCSACAPGFSGLPPRCVPTGCDKPASCGLCPTGYAPTASGACAITSLLLDVPSASAAPALPIEVELFASNPGSSYTCVTRARFNPAIIALRTASSVPAVAWTTASCGTAVSVASGACSADAFALPGVALFGAGPVLDGCRVELSVTMAGLTQQTVSVPIRPVPAPAVTSPTLAIRSVTLDDAGATVPLFGIRFSMLVEVSVAAADPTSWIEFTVDGTVARLAARGVPTWRVESHEIAGRPVGARVCATSSGVACVTVTESVILANLAVPLARERPGGSPSAVLAVTAAAVASRGSLDAEEASASDAAAASLVRAAADAVLAATRSDPGSRADAAFSFARAASAVGRAAGALSPAALVQAQASLRSSSALLGALVPIATSRQDALAMALAVAHDTMACGRAPGGGPPGPGGLDPAVPVAAAKFLALQSPGGSVSLGPVHARVVDAEALYFAEASYMALKRVSVGLTQGLTTARERGSFVAAALATCRPPSESTLGLAAGGEPTPAPALAVAFTLDLGTGFPNSPALDTAGGADTWADPVDSVLALVGGATGIGSNVPVALRKAVVDLPPPAGANSTSPLPALVTRWAAASRGGKARVTDRSELVAFVGSPRGTFTFTRRCTDQATGVLEPGTAEDPDSAMCACRGDAIADLADGLYCPRLNATTVAACLPNAQLPTGGRLLTWTSFAGDLVASVQSATPVTRVALLPRVSGPAAPALASLACLYPSATRRPGSSADPFARVTRAGLLPGATSCTRDESVTGMFPVPTVTNSLCGFESSPVPSTGADWHRGTIEVATGAVLTRWDVLVETSGSKLSVAPSSDPATVTKTPSTMPATVLASASARLTDVARVASNSSINVRLTWEVTLVGPVAINTLTAGSARANFQLASSAAVPRQAAISDVSGDPLSCSIFNVSSPCTQRVSYLVELGTDCSPDGVHEVTGLDLVCRGLSAASGSPACVPGSLSPGRISFKSPAVKVFPASLCSAAYTSVASAPAFAQNGTQVINGTFFAETSTVVPAVAHVTNQAPATDAVITGASFTGPSARFFALKNATALVGLSLLPRMEGRIPVDVIFSPEEAGRHEVQLVVSARARPESAAATVSTAALTIVAEAKAGPPRAPVPLSLRIARLNSTCSYVPGVQIEIVFAPLTNTPSLATRADVDKVFAFSMPIGDSYTGFWRADNRTAVINVTNPGQALLCNERSLIGTLRVSTTAVRVAGSTGPQSRFAGGQSPPLEVTTRPVALSAVLSDPDDGDACLSAGDVVVVTYDRPTNNGTGIMFSTSTASTAITNFTVGWSGDSRVATVTLLSSTANCSLPVIGAVSLAGSTDVRDATGTSGPSDNVVPLGGSVGRPYTVINATGVLVNATAVVYRIYFSGPPTPPWLWEQMSNPQQPYFRASDHLEELKPTEADVARWESPTVLAVTASAAANATAAVANGTIFTIRSTSPLATYLRNRASPRVVDATPPKPVPTPTPPAPSTAPAGPPPMVASIISEHNTTLGPKVPARRLAAQQASAGPTSAASVDPSTRILTGDGILFTLSSAIASLPVGQVYTRAEIDRNVTFTPRPAEDYVGHWFNSSLFVILITKGTLPYSAAPRPSDLTVTLSTLVLPGTSVVAQVSGALTTVRNGTVALAPVSAATQNYDGSYDLPSATPGKIGTSNPISVAPAAAPEAWAKRNWWAVLLIVLAIVIIVGIVAVVFASRSKRAVEEGAGKAEPKAKPAVVRPEVAPGRGKGTPEHPGPAPLPALVKTAKRDNEDDAIVEQEVDTAKRESGEKVAALEEKKEAAAEAAAPPPAPPPALAAAAAVPAPPPLQPEPEFLKQIRALEELVSREREERLALEEAVLKERRLKDQQAAEAEASKTAAPAIPPELIDHIHALELQITKEREDRLALEARLVEQAEAHKPAEREADKDKAEPRPEPVESPVEDVEKAAKKVNAAKDALEAALEVLARFDNGERQRGVAALPPLVQSSEARSAKKKGKKEKRKLPALHQPLEEEEEEEQKDGQKKEEEEKEEGERRGEKGKGEAERVEKVDKAGRQKQKEEAASPIRRPPPTLPSEATPPATPTSIRPLTAPSQASPAAARSLRLQDMVSAAAVADLTTRFHAWDTDKDGLISINEYQERAAAMGLSGVPARVWFDLRDRDGDGFVTLDEYLETECMLVMEKDVGQAGMLRLLPGPILRKARAAFMASASSKDGDYMTVPVAELDNAVENLHREALQSASASEKSTAALLELAKSAARNIIPNNGVNIGWNEFIACQAKFILATHNNNN